MLSHGGHARELNLWASKLRKYNCKHFQRVDRTRKCTLYGEASNQSEFASGSQTTDLQRCVQLLSHLLETDGSLMGGPGARKQVPKRSTKPKKKRVHVVPQPKLLSKNVVGRASLGRNGLGKSGAAVKKTGLHGKGQWAGRHRFTASEVLATGEENDEIAEDHFTQPAPQQQMAGSDVSEPVPYNTRLASSTPNNTLLKELSEYQASCDTAIPPSSPQARNLGFKKGNFNSASAKKNTHDCKQFSKNAPDLPLVFLNTEYNLTPGQSNPLNSSSQVDVMHPPEVRPVPKLIQGKVDFVPNPCAWFHTNKSSTEPQSSDVAPDVATSSGVQQQPWDVQCEGGHRQPPHPLDPPEREVNFSLYTNPADGNAGAEIGQQGAPPSASVQQGAARITDPSACHHPAAVSGLQNADKCSSQTKSTSSESSCNTNVIEIPTGMRKLPSETKVKRLASSKDSTSTNNRLTKTTKKKHSVKNKENAFRKTPKVKSKVDKAVQFAINNAATQCSPESNHEHEMEMLNLLTICTDPCMSQQSMRHMMALQCLLEDMKALVKPEQNSKLDLLIKQIEQTAAMFVPGLGGIDWRTELELAIQPLRSENAQLRRRLRITNQQMKETKYQLERNEKPDPSFHTVHLELLQHKLKQDYEEVKSSRDKLRDRLKELQAELDKVRSERAKLLEIMVNKDAERHKAEHKWNEDVARHRRDTERALEETNRALRERDLLQKQLQLVHISLDQRDKEIARLRNIVRNLQDSMRALFNKLTTMAPAEELVDTFTDGAGNNLLDGDVLLASDENRTPTGYHGDENDHGIPGLNTASGHSSARRVLPFSESKAQKQSRVGQSQVKNTTHPSRELFNVTSSPREEVADHDHRTADTDDMKWNNDSLNDTDYITAPGTSPMKKIFTRRMKIPATVDHQSHLYNGAPTVKELLTPLKDRLQTQYKRMSAGSHRKSHETSSEKPSVPVVPEEERFDDLEVAPLDGTLCEEASDSGEDATLRGNVTKDEGDAADTRASSDEVSRYSITDYFRKYQRGDDNTSAKKAPDDLEGSTLPKSGFSSSDVNTEMVNGMHDDGIDVDSAEMGHRRRSDPNSPRPQPLTPDSGKPKTHSSNGHASFQDSVYKGTVLETSISTIGDEESVASSAMTLSSVGTIDDSNFQQGLADLDANIARIQAQLQASLAQYS